LHRLDRTSLRLAHSFDHLVGPAEQREREGEAERLGGLEVDNQLDLHRQRNNLVARLLKKESAPTQTVK
jgi:hypothetical protein